MTKRIFRNILLTAMGAVLLSAAILVISLYLLYESSAISALRSEAAGMVRALDLLEDDAAYLSGLEGGSRITLIAPDGQVIYDSTADASELESHAGRTEVLQALKTGEGKSRRFSSTLSEMTLNYACLTSEGQVLRLSAARSSVLGIFAGITPQILLMLLGVGVLSMFIAKLCAQQIVAPVNSLDLDVLAQTATYEELAPLLLRLDRQRLQIRQQMRDLARAHSELSAIMENMREGLVLMDRQSEVLSMNASAAAILEAHPDKRVGVKLGELCHDEGVAELVQGAQEGQSSDMILERGMRTYRLLASPVQQQEEIRGVVLFMLDVTERYAAEASRREFTANVSHELKTPLTSISGYAEIIRDGIARAEDVPAFAGKIHSEAKRLLALVNDIMELSRLDEKRGLGGKEQVPLGPMLEGLKEGLLSMAQEKGVTLTLHAEDVEVRGYPLLLDELFYNLMENALKYTPSGGSVRVTAAVEEGHVVCRVADTGIGIPVEHQAHIFERFYRVDKSHSRQTGGTGLGLAIVKHAAQVHHASVEVQSEPGQGTIMTVRF